MALYVALDTASLRRLSYDCRRFCGTDAAGKGEVCLAVCLGNSVGLRSRCWSRSFAGGKHCRINVGVEFLQAWFLHDGSNSLPFGFWLSTLQLIPWVSERNY
jgi:hypothetical protein